MAIVFDDANGDYLSGGSVLGSLPLTVSAWFNTDAASLTQRVFALTGGGPQFHECRLDGTAQTISAISQSIGSSSATSGNTWSVNQWHHGIWVLGDASRSVALDGGTTVTNTDARAVSVTATAVAGASSPFSGRIAELAAWDADVLTGTDGEAIKRALAKGFSPPAVRAANLIAWFRFLRGEVQDVIGNFVLTPTGSPAAGGHPRIWTKRSGGRLLKGPPSARLVSLGGAYRAGGGRIVLAG